MDLEKLCGSPIRIRILKYLLENGQANITRLSRELGIHHTVLRRHIRELESLGIVEERKFERLHIYAINLADPRVAALRDLIRELEAL